MGQYHQIMNFDKKEVLEPTSFRKLMEWSWQGNETLLQLEQLLKTEWKGDKVLVVGDYVEDVGEDSQFQDLFQEIKKENQEYQDINNIYDYPYKSVSVSLSRCPTTPSRYIYNTALKEYLDLKKQPIQYVGFDQTYGIYGSKIHPLSLMLSVSNGLGGGDYHSKHPSSDQIGSWASTSDKIIFSDKPLYDPKYTELEIFFDEMHITKEFISNEDELLQYIIENYFVYSPWTNLQYKNINEICRLEFDPCLFLTKAEKNRILEKAINAIVPSRCLPVYTQTAEYAREHREMPIFLASYHANVACKNAIETALSTHYDETYHLDAKAALDELVEDFSIERIGYVLANTVQHKDWDGRFHPKNRAWANTVLITPDEKTFNFIVESHSTIVNALIDQFRNELETYKEQEEDIER